MKYLFVIGCLLLVTDMIRADEVDFKAAIEEYITPCAAEHNVLPEEIPKMDEGDLEGDERMRIGCMNTCIMKKMEVFDGTQFNLDKYKDMAMKIFENDEVRVASEMEKIAGCSEKMKDITDECEVGYLLSRCVKQ